MKELLFKSKELTIVADSETKVVYGTTSRDKAINILCGLIPETGEEAMRHIALTIIILTSKYVMAKINITVEIAVKTAKSSVVKTAEDALRIASKFGLEAEVQRELDNSATPLEALREWDILQYCFSSSES